MSGLKIEHSQKYFEEQKEVILTLKDKNVLDENDEDVLVNVNIVDQENTEKHIENKKKKPTYKPFDEFDEYGVVSRFITFCMSLGKGRLIKKSELTHFFQVTASNSNFNLI